LGEVGDYALQLTWGDGHATGIYTFVFLRELCACALCRPELQEQDKHEFHR
jgi:DUF971 family protein